MADEKMTLIERLRNPQWVHDMRPGSMAVLDTEPTRNDLNQAANQIEQMETALDKIRLTEGVPRSIEKLALDAFKH